MYLTHVWIEYYLKKSIFQKFPVGRRTGPVGRRRLSMPYPGYATNLNILWQTYKLLINNVTTRSDNQWDSIVILFVIIWVLIVLHMKIKLKPIGYNKLNDMINIIIKYLRFQRIVCFPNDPCMKICGEPRNPIMSPTPSECPKHNFPESESVYWKKKFRSQSYNHLR
jgi:hypothetical protein